MKYNLKRVKDIYSAIITTGIKPGDPLASGAPTPAAPTAAPAAPVAPSRDEIEQEMKRRGLLGGAASPAPPVAAAAPPPYVKDASTGSGIRAFSMPYGSLGG